MAHHGSSRDHKESLGRVIAYRPIKDHPELEVIVTPVSVFDSTLHLPGNDDKSPRALNKEFDVEGLAHDALRVDQISCVEYRVYNFRSYPSGKIIRGDGWNVWNVLFLAIWVHYTLGLKWHQTHTDEILGNTLLSFTPEKLKALLSLFALSLFLVYKSLTPLHQSLLVIPGHGLQLNTVRGVSVPRTLAGIIRHPTKRYLWPVVRQSQFMAHSGVSNIIINEVLTRWSVGYRLAVVKRQGKGVVVIFDEVKPHVSVLKSVYRGSRDIMFDR